MLIVKSVKMKYILLIGFVVFVSSCKAEEIDFKGMDSSEKAFNERQRKELVAYMSLETMFPDDQVRTLAEAAGEGVVKKIGERLRKSSCFLAEQESPAN